MSPGMDSEGAPGFILGQPWLCGHSESELVEGITVVCVCVCGTWVVCVCVCGACVMCVCGASVCNCPSCIFLSSTCLLPWPLPLHPDPVIRFPSVLLLQEYVGTVYWDGRGTLIKRILNSLCKRHARAVKVFPKRKRHSNPSPGNSRTSSTLFVFTPINISTEFK